MLWTSMAVHWHVSRVESPFCPSKSHALKSTLWRKLLVSPVKRGPPLPNPENLCGRSFQIHRFSSFNCLHSPRIKLFKFIIWTPVAQIKGTALAKENSLDDQASSHPGSLPSCLVRATKDAAPPDRTCSPWIALSIPPKTLPEGKNCIILDSAQDWVCQRCFSHRIVGQFFSFLLLWEVSGTRVLSNRKPGKQLEGTETCLDSYILDSLIAHPWCNGFKQRFVGLFFQKSAWREIIVEEITSSSPNRMKSKSKGQIKYPEPGSEEWK